jgi:serine/threonine-protein kinase GIN4
MSTTGVKRVGLGYQSDNPGALTHARSKGPAPKPRFLTARRHMPPPVSSEDLRKAASTSADEFGSMTRAPVSVAAIKEDSGNPVGIVRRALKAMTVKR